MTCLQQPRSLQKLLQTWPSKLCFLISLTPQFVYAALRQHVSTLQGAVRLHRTRLQFAMLSRHVQSIFIEDQINLSQLYMCVSCPAAQVQCLQTSHNCGAGTCVTSIMQDNMLLLPVTANCHESAVGLHMTSTVAFATKVKCLNNIGTSSCSKQS